MCIRFLKRKNEEVLTGIKQFFNITDMNNSVNNKEGDLAVVYRNEVHNATVDSKFQVATFPETVVLDTALTGKVEVRYRAVDSSKMFDCMGSLNSSRFSMDCRTETGRIRIQYTSFDGITYTRTDTTGNPVDFGTEIYYERTDRWNDVIGKFIQVGRSTFEGLFEYGEYTEPLIVKLPKTSGLSYDPDTNEISTGESILVDINKILSIVKDKISMTDFSIFSLDETNTKFGIFYQTSGNSSKQVGDDECYYAAEHEVYVATAVNLDTYSHHLITIDTTNSTFADEELSIVSTERFNVPVYSLGVRISIDNENVRLLNNTIYVYTSKSEENPVLNKDIAVEYHSYYKYILAPTQLTAIADYVYEKEFYGQNGVETGTLTQDISNSFTDMNAEVYGKIQNYYDNLEPRVLTDSDKTIDKSIRYIPTKSDGTLLLNTSSVTNMGRMFQNCTNLTTIPLLDTSSVTNMESMFTSCTNLTTIPLLNTSSVTNMTNMFWNCTNLTTIPLLDTSSVTGMTKTFYGCTSLSDESLNNILAMCKNATSFPYTKTLAFIGLTSAQATKCTTLSNYSAFTAAGWTTGY